MTTSSAILRVFEVRACAGAAETLKQKLSATSVSVVEGQPGNLGYGFGTDLSGDGRDLVFISVWRDLDAIKARFGDQWEQSFLPEGYDALIESCSIKHLEIASPLLALANLDDSVSRD